MREPYDTDPLSTARVIVFAALWGLAIWLVLIDAALYLTTSR